MMIFTLLTFYSNACIIILTLKKLFKFHEQNFNDRRFFKYIKNHNLKSYDNFCMRENVSMQKLKWFSKRAKSYVKYNKKFNINVNDDSNFDFDEKFDEFVKKKNFAKFWLIIHRLLFRVWIYAIWKAFNDNI